MMKMIDILREATGQLRKGEVFTGSPDLVQWAKDGFDAERQPDRGGLEVFDMPADTDPAFDGLERVDMHFVTVVVDKAKAEARRGEFIAALDAWPNPAELAGGPSYIAAGGTLGDQGFALEMFALGKVLGVWDVITPETMGITGEDAKRMAGAGFVMCSGYRP